MISGRGRCAHANWPVGALLPAPGQFVFQHSGEHGDARVSEMIRPHFHGAKLAEERRADDVQVGGG